MLTSGVLARVTGARALAVGFLLLSGLGSAAAQSGDLDRCKSVDASNTSVSLDDAIAACTAIIDGNRETGRPLAEAYVWRGTAFMRKPDLDRALDDFSKAIGADPTFPRAHNARGIVHARKGRQDDAIADYSECIRLSATSSRCFDNRGLAYRNKGDNARAIADFSEALRIDPRYALGFAHRGWTYNLTREYDKAIADFDEALRLDSRMTSAYNDRGVVWRNKGDT